MPKKREFSITDKTGQKHFVSFIASVEYGSFGRIRCLDWRGKRLEDTDVPKNLRELQLLANLSSFQSFTNGRVDFAFAEALFNSPEAIEDMELSSNEMNNSCTCSFAMYITHAQKIKDLRDLDHLRSSFTEALKDREYVLPELFANWLKPGFVPGKGIRHCDSLKNGLVFVGGPHCEFNFERMLIAYNIPAKLHLPNYLLTPESLNETFDFEVKPPVEFVSASPVAVISCFERCPSVDGTRVNGIKDITNHFYPIYPLSDLRSFERCSDGNVRLLDFHDKQLDRSDFAKCLILAAYGSGDLIEMSKRSCFWLKTKCSIFGIGEALFLSRGKFDNMQLPVEEIINSYVLSVAISMINLARIQSFRDILINEVTVWGIERIEVQSEVLEAAPNVFVREPYKSIKSMLRSCGPNYSDACLVSILYEISEALEVREYVLPKLVANWLAPGFAPGKGVQPLSDRGALVGGPKFLFNLDRALRALGIEVSPSSLYGMEKPQSLYRGLNSKLCELAHYEALTAKFDLKRRLPDGPLSPMEVVEHFSRVPELRESMSRADLEGQTRRSLGSTGAVEEENPTRCLVM